MSEAICPQTYYFLSTIWFEGLKDPVLGLFCFFFLMLIVFSFLWIFSRLINGLSALFGSSLRPEQEVTDEGSALERDLNNFPEVFSSRVNGFFQNLKEIQETRITKTIQAIKTNLNQPKNEFSAFVESHPTMESLTQEIDALQSTLTTIVFQGMATHFPGRKSSMIGTFASFREIVRDLISKTKRSYVLLKTEENLGFETGDSLTVKVAKVFRRIFRFFEAHIRWLNQPLHVGKKGIKLVKVRVVSFRSILRFRFEAEKYFLSIHPALMEIEKSFSNFQPTLRDLDRVIRFNLNSAIDEIKDKDKSKTKEDRMASAKQTVLGTFDRVLVRLDTYAKDLDTQMCETPPMVLKNFDHVYVLVRRDCEFADTIGEIITKVYTRLWRLVLEQGQALLVYARQTPSLVQKWITHMVATISRARTKLGIDKSVVVATPDSLDQATIEYAQQKLPAMYRRVFRFEPIQNEEFFVGRDKEMELFQKAKTRWESGLRTSVALHGPIGSGKTSLINKLEKTLFTDKPIKILNLDRQILSVEQLRSALSFVVGWKDPQNSLDDEQWAEKFSGDCENHIIVIEGAQHLFTRMIGGFGILTAFRRLMDLTQPRIFWVVGFSEVAWDYLDATKIVFNQFTYVISTENVDRETMEDVILVRHDITGYNLQFLEEGPIPRDLKWRLQRIRDEEKRQEILRKRYFDELHEISRGNLTAALYYWLCSLSFDDNQSVQVKFPTSIRLEPFRLLTPLQLATMLTVLQHGTIDEKVHGRVFRLPDFQSQGILRELEDRRFLIQLNKDRYTPNPITVTPLLQVLRERNLVYHD